MNETTPESRIPKPLKIVLIAAAAVLLALLLIIGILHYQRFLSIGWHDDGTTYMDSLFHKATGLKEIKGEYYLFDEQGTLLCGWNRFGGFLYYSDRDGVIARGDKTVDDTLYHFSPEDGRLYQGLTVLDGKSYWYADDGSRVTGTVETDGGIYLFGEDGVMVKGLAGIGEDSFFFGEDGFRVYGPAEVDGIRYGFDPETGAMITDSVFTFEDAGYRTDENGQIVTGWYENENGTFYYDETGRAVSGTVTVDGTDYFFADDGRVGSGWQQRGEDTVYVFPTGEYAVGDCEVEGLVRSFTDDGALLLGWVNDEEWRKQYYGEDGVRRVGFADLGEGTIYYFDEKGYLCEGINSGVITIGEEEYCLDTDGALRTGWLEKDDKQYYHNDHGFPASGLTEIDGVMYGFAEEEDPFLCRGGWFTIGGARIYTDAEGKAVNGKQTIGGQTYNFENYQLISGGWVKVGGKRFFFDEKSHPLTGKQTIDGVQYCFRDDGEFATGWYTKDGTTLYLNTFGFPLTGLQTIGGKLYYFNGNGSLARDTVVGLYQIGPDGVASNLVATRENFDYYISQILKTIDTSPEGIFNYIRTFRYKATDNGADSIDNAIYLLNNRKGACYHFSALSYHLLTAAGYEAIIIHGDGLYNAPEHYWNMIKLDGKWYHYDALQKQYLKTTKQLIAAGYNWPFADFPEA